MLKETIKHLIKEPKRTMRYLQEKRQIKKVLKSL